MITLLEKEYYGEAVLHLEQDVAEAIWLFVYEQPNAKRWICKG